MRGKQVKRKREVKRKKRKERKKNTNEGKRKGIVGKSAHGREMKIGGNV